MRFIVALLIASLFVDKAGSELSFIPRHNLYPCASYSPGVRSQKYSHPYPLTSIPRASYPFLFDHGGGARQNRKTHIGFRDNQARTDDFHHVKVTLYRWVIPLPCPHQEIELTNPKAKDRETQQRHYSWTTWSQAFLSHYYGYENNGKGWIQLSTAPIGNRIDYGFEPYTHGFIKPYDSPDLNQAGFTWRRFASACSIRYG